MFVEMTTKSSDFTMQKASSYFSRSSTVVTAVNTAGTSVEDLEKYEDAFCIVKSEDFVVISTNIDTQDLYFLLDQIKLALITRGDYEI